MPTSPSSAPEVPNRANGIILLPATRFFARFIPLVAGQDQAAQVELALESIGPFTPGQLYYGYCPSRDGSGALVFAAYRKNFSAAETAEWSNAAAVLPEFAVWLGQSARVAKGVWLHEHESTLSAIVWDGAGELPVGLISRDVSGGAVEAVRRDLLQEVDSRFGAVTHTTRTFTDAVKSGVPGKEGLELKAGGQAALLSPAQLRAMDVRDKAELAGQLGRSKRDRVLWLTFASAAAALVACVAVEAGVQVANLLIARERRALEANVPAVEEIKKANQVAARMENLAGQSLRPFEMLVLLDSVRPPTLEFVRATTSGPRQMDLEAQSANAADPQDYEKALSRMGNVEKVELRDLRTSAGKTTFLVAVAFKPGFAGQGVAR